MRQAQTCRSSLRHTGLARVKQLFNFRHVQAMDRAHRIGQTQPVLVLRLATAHSVEGRLLARANSKLALERLVIKRGEPAP